MRTKKLLIRTGSLFLLVLLAGLFWAPSLLMEARLRLGVFGGGTYAVYMDTGHIFYGKLKALGGGTIVLADVRSFQKFEVGQESTNTLAAQMENPITKPENFLVIQRQHVVFFEKVGSSAPILNLGAGAQ